MEAQAGGGATDSIEVYDLASNTWDSPFTLQKPRTGHSAASVGSNIYVIGGAIKESLAGIVGTVEELTVATDQKAIGFTLVSDFDKKAPRSDAVIFFAYYDPEKGQWEKSSQRTDSSGRCSFMVPGGEQGESYTFLYATGQGKMDKAIKDASDGKRFAWRIPPGEQQELELLTDGERASNTKGSVQMWSIRKSNR